MESVKPISKSAMPSCALFQNTTVAVHNGVAHPLNTTGAHPHDCNQFIHSTDRAAPRVASRAAIRFTKNTHRFRSKDMKHPASARRCLSTSSPWSVPVYRCLPSRTCLHGNCTLLGPADAVRLAGQRVPPDVVVLWEVQLCSEGRC